MSELFSVQPGVFEQAPMPIQAPAYFNFGYDIVDVIAEKDRNRLAMIWVNQEGEERRFTFRDMSHLSNQAANLLVKFGISYGDRVMIQLPRVPEWWIFSLALIKIGAIQCITPTLLTTDDVKERIIAARIKMVITDMKNAPKFDAVSEDCPTLRSMLVTDGERDNWISYRKEISPPNYLAFNRVVGYSQFRSRYNAPMLMMFTSGTSRAPKIAVHNFVYPLGHLITAKLWHGIGSNDLVYTVSDTGWGKNIWGNYFGQWMCGACVLVFDIRDHFRAEEVLPLIERYGVTSFCAPPTVYRMLVLHDLTKYDFKALRTCCSAGEVLHAETAKLWEEATGLTIREAYGQTETVCMIGSWANIPHKPGSIGTPAPGWDVRLIDDAGNEIPREDTESIGRIAVNISKGKPLGLFIKYADNPEENEKSFIGDYYFTGDCARRDADGYFWFVGRNDGIIKTSGYRVGPGEIEEVMMRHPAVAEVAVIGIPDPLRGARIKAYIIAAPGVVPTDSLVSQIQQHTRRLTAPYKCPRDIEFISSLPKTISGKVKRDVLLHYHETGDRTWEN